MSAGNQLPVMTVTEFLDWPTPDGSDRHGAILGPPDWESSSGAAPGLPCGDRARNPPSGHNVRIPDLSVTCGPIDPTARFGSPVLIVEILSPSNWQKTIRNVASYASIEGLAEVFVLHNTRMLAQVFRRGASGAWDEIAAMTASDELVELTSIGFTTPLAAFYRTVH